MGEGTNKDVGVVPKTPDSKMVLLVRRTLPERERILCSLCQEESLFSFTHATSPFPLETSGSFFKFNSFLFIYLFIFLKSNFLFFIYLFVPYTVTNHASPHNASFIPTVHHQSRFFVSFSHLLTVHPQSRFSTSFSHSQRQYPGLRDSSAK